MNTEPRSVKTRAAVTAEVSDERFSLQEIALDEAKNDIAGLNEWLERAEVKIAKSHKWEAFVPIFGLD
ncbi:hypothetical protein OUZ56_029858 [Daphnia magna]|uniref:Uncharacterized protein n=1 Tax=Daphnia magna TaxID=35525 RepID=A0ABR0B8H3_9CRUS|nr:hypothetical protein OUZ56_029858 [Daphnia magna]